MRFPLSFVLNIEFVQAVLSNPRKKEGILKVKVRPIEKKGNLENMLKKLVEVNGDFSQLKQWEKRSYKAYQIEEIKSSILSASPSAWKDTDLPTCNSSLEEEIQFLMLFVHRTWQEE
jgi:hypothetical protein